MTLFARKSEPILWEKRPRQTSSFSDSGGEKHQHAPSVVSLSVFTLWSVLFFASCLFFLNESRRKTKIFCFSPCFLPLFPGPDPKNERNQYVSWCPEAAWCPPDAFLVGRAPVESDFASLCFAFVLLCLKFFFSRGEAVFFCLLSSSQIFHPFQGGKKRKEKNKKPKWH